MSQETIRAAERAAGQVKTMSTYDPDSDQLHEECGIFGVWAPDRDVARLTYFGLRALQHRGQESAGIAVGDGGTVMVRKDLGLLDRVVSNADLSTLSGQLAVGTCAMALPVPEREARSHLHHQQRHYRSRTGTLVNTDECAGPIELGVPFLSNSDSRSRPSIGYFTQRKLRYLRGHSQDHGAVRGGRHALINEQALCAFRDRGIRHSCWASWWTRVWTRPCASVSSSPRRWRHDGRLRVHVIRAGGGRCFETALDIVGAEYVRDVRPARDLCASAPRSGIGWRACARARQLHLEQVYFALDSS
ncbi:MAG: hypothetical protein ACLU37_05730 [Collinsella sp.]